MGVLQEELLSGTSLMHRTLMNARPQLTKSATGVNWMNRKNKIIIYSAIFFISIPVVISFFIRIPLPDDHNPPLFRFNIVTDNPSKTAKDKIIAASLKAWQPNNDYWPEPARITETDYFWYVAYKVKDCHYIQYWLPVTAKHKPGFTTIKVSKADYSCNICPAR